MLNTHHPCVWKLSNCFAARVAVFFSACFFCFHPQPIKTLWSAQRYSGAVHMSVLLLPKTKGRRLALVPCDACHLRLITIRWFGSSFLERWHRLCLRVMVTIYKHSSNYNMWMKLKSRMKFFCGDLQLLIKPSRLYSQLIEISYPFSICNEWTAFSQQIFTECFLYEAQDSVLNMFYLVRQKNNYRGRRKYL